MGGEDRGGGHIVQPHPKLYQAAGQRPEAGVLAQGGPKGGRNPQGFARPISEVPGLPTKAGTTVP